MRVLLDTSVILDHILSNESHAEAARKIFDLVCQDEIEAVVTANSITDIYYVVAKRLGDATAREALRNLFAILVIIGVDGNDCISALDLPMPDFEDALVAVCAAKTDVAYIVTNDKGFLQNKSSTALVITPRDLLELL